MSSRSLALVLFGALLAAAGAFGYFMLEDSDLGPQDRIAADTAGNSPPRGTALGEPTRDGAEPVELEPLVSRVTDRYEARLIDASVTSTRSHEARDVYELRFLTRQGNVLRVRFDAITGDWLETEGRGQIEARKLPER